MIANRDRLTWLATNHFTVDGVEFVESYLPGSNPGPFHIRKHRALVEAYVELLDGFHGADVVELGVAQGGSLALLALLAAPHKVVAMELSPTRIERLDALVDERDLGESVRAHYGVDQGDQARVLQIVRDELGDAPLDLVVDDASHLLGPTRASFDVLFPLVRPGGLYVIEDWNWQHKMVHSLRVASADPDSPSGMAMADHLVARLEEPGSDLEARFATALAERLASGNPAERARIAAALDDRLSSPADQARFEALSASGTASADPLDSPLGRDGDHFLEDGRPSIDTEPLAALVIDLLLARASDGDVVREITVGEFWVGVRRGSAALDPGSFRIGEAFDDRHRLRWSPAPG